MGSRLGTKAGSELPLIGVTTSEIRRKDAVRPTPEGEPATGRDGAGPQVRAGDRGGRERSPSCFPRSCRRSRRRCSTAAVGRLPLRRPRSRPGGLWRPPAPATGPDRARPSTASSSTSRGSPGDCGMPVLAICRGAQALNVRRGGTLHPAPAGRSPTRRSSIARLCPRGERPTTCWSSPGRCCADLLGRRTLEVNSFHHQAVERLGNGLRVAARATDGVVEAVEAPGRPFVVGVQWHAECLGSRAEHGSSFRGPGAVGAALTPGCVARSEAA